MFFVVLGAVSPVPAAEDAGSWPQFHGPKRDNISTASGLLKRWPDGGPKLLWTARGIGEGFATVSIADGAIYTAGNVGEETVITAMDIGGRILWQTPNGRAWTESPPGARGTPTIDGGRLFHENPSGDVVCLDAKTGKKVWGLNLCDTFRGKPPTWGMAESLLIDGPRVISSPGGPQTAIVALDKTSGRLVWKSPTATGDVAGYASPILAECQGLRIILTLTARALIGVNADNGDLLWRFEHVTPFDENICSPIYRDGQVFISTRTTGSVMLKIEVSGGRASVAELWRTKQLDNQHGGVILLDGHLYGACHVNNNAKWVCLDWKTGREMYAEHGVGKGSLTYADGMFYMLSEQGTLGLVEAIPTDYRLVSRFKPPAGGEGLWWAHPVVFQGRLYIRHVENLYVYDVRAK